MIRKFIICILILLIVSCTKPLYYSELKKIIPLENKNHLIYELSSDIELFPQKDYIIIYDILNNKIHYCSKNHKNKIIKIDSTGFRFSSKYENFIINNMINKNCDTIIKLSKTMSLMVYSKNFLYEIKDNKIVNKCEYEPFILE
jgi:hypothetical protein